MNYFLFWETLVVKETTSTLIRSAQLCAGKRIKRLLDKRN